MLKYLHIENIAVIQETDIEFTNGFNVLTGETGAGKSIIIDSINAVLGERTSKDLIREDCDFAVVSALFGDLSQENIKRLRDYSIVPDDDGNILITRKLSTSGKGLIKVNSKPVTVSELKEIAAGLINIHGQHDNQALLKPEMHCGFVDAIAQNESQIDNYYAEFKNLNNIRRELSSLVTDDQEKQRKTELLKYQIKEIEEADIKPCELSELKEKLKIAESFENTQKSLRAVENILLGDEENDGVLNRLKIAEKQLASLKSQSFENDLKMLLESISQIEEVSSDVQSFLDNEEYLNLDINEINQRLDLIHRLMLKYGNSEEEILSFCENAKNELEGIKFADKRYDDLSELLEKAKLSLIDLGEKLTDTRIKASAFFENEVSKVLAYLNMPNVKFKVDLQKGRYTKNGCDVVEFLISANTGEAVKPLSKIASGGELSRTMLAIKSVLLDKDPVDTMIFDEIDTGISGFAADKVANQLKTVSKKRQVICVTHLAQIAARADNHLLIDKAVKNGRTFTDVKALTYEDRITELARIMSGSSVTKSLYNSAKELLDRS